MREWGRHVLVNLVGDGRVEVGREEEGEEVLGRGHRRRRRPGDEAGDAMAPRGGREQGEDAVDVGGVLALRLGEEAAEGVDVGVEGVVGGADVGRRLGVGGSELAREAHAVLVRVAAHGWVMEWILCSALLLRGVLEWIEPAAKS